MELPIFLHEIDVQNTDYFKFLLPECYAGGHENIEISVEHGKTINDENTVTYNAWARKRDSSVKFFIFTNRVPATDNTVYNIMADMNENQEFETQINKFIEFTDKRSI